MAARKKKRARSVQDEKYVRFTVSIQPSLLERARTVAYFEPGMTLAGLIREGLDKVVTRYEQRRKKPYPRRRGDLPRGRSLS